MVNYCSYCGEKIFFGYKFCTKCGKQIQRSLQQAQETIRQESAALNKDRVLEEINEAKKNRSTVEAAMAIGTLFGGILVILGVILSKGSIILGGNFLTGYWGLQGGYQTSNISIDLGLLIFIASLCLGIIGYVYYDKDYKKWKKML